MDILSEVQVHEADLLPELLSNKIKLKIHCWSLWS